MPAELSQEEADRRWSQIVALWLQIESEVVAPDAPYQSLDAPWSARWDEERLRAAKAIAKGEKPPLERFFGESSMAYLRRIARTQDQIDGEVISDDLRSYEAGLEGLRRLIAVSNEQLGKLTGKPGVTLTGVTLRQAFEAYEAEIKGKKKYMTPDGKRKTPGHPTPCRPPPLPFVPHRSQSPGDRPNPKPRTPTITAAPPACIPRR